MREGIGKEGDVFCGLGHLSAYIEQAMFEHRLFYLRETSFVV